MMASEMKLLRPEKPSPTMPVYSEKDVRLPTVSSPEPGERQRAGQDVSARRGRRMRVRPS